MLHTIITVTICAVILWTASTAIILAFTYAATKGRDCAQPVRTAAQPAKDRTNAR